MLISEITALVKCSSPIKRMQGSEFQIVKQPVFCPHCHEERLFTLRAIADNPQRRCHGCGGRICLADRVYGSLVRDVRNLLEAIDSYRHALFSPRMKQVGASRCGADRPERLMAPHQVMTEDE
jgi:hypothetical protein